MNTETELKYRINSEKEGLEILSYLLNCEHCISENTQNSNMRAIYYDNESHTLSENKIGFRIRRENENIIATVKYSDFRTDSGFSKRYEYNIPVKDEIPDLKIFNNIIENSTICEILRNVNPKPMFITEFLRKFLLIKYKASTIEIAFDNGKIFSPKKSIPICELECELKSGT